jgi:hypothetical protein
LRGERANPDQDRGDDSRFKRRDCFAHGDSSLREQECVRSDDLGALRFEIVAAQRMRCDMDKI